MLSTVETVVRRIQPDASPIRARALEHKAQTYGALRSALEAAAEATNSIAVRPNKPGTLASA